MKRLVISMLATCMCLSITACSQKTTEVISPTTPDEAIALLKSQNEKYLKAEQNEGDISLALREETVENGQDPYAVVLTCSDSRVVPEHIFMSGISEIFTIRNAGNVVSDIDLGSVEYGAEHLDAKVIVVLGHTHCGAVDATLSGGAEGNIVYITSVIAEAIGNETDARQAEILNVQNSIEQIEQSEIISHLVEEGKTKVVGAIYDAETGEVSFLD